MEEAQEAVNRIIKFSPQPPSFLFPGEAGELQFCLFGAVATAGQAPPSLPAAASARAAVRHGPPLKSLGNHWEKTIMNKTLE